MLHDAQRTSAPSATSVSISTAVWIVMCSEPVIRAPRSGCCAPYSRRSAIRPGISCSASVDLLAPELGEREVGDAEVLQKDRRHGSWSCSSFRNGGGSNARKRDIDGRRRSTPRRGRCHRLSPGAVGLGEPVITSVRVRVSSPTGSKWVMRLNSAKRCSISSMRQALQPLAAELLDREGGDHRAVDGGAAERHRRCPATREWWSR